MPPRDEAALLDIAKAARAVLCLVQHLNQEAFLSDLTTHLAILGQLVSIGAAVKRLSPEFRALHPRTPWSLFAGMHDQLTQCRVELHWREICKTVTTDVPGLLSQIEPLLPKETAE